MYEIIFVRLYVPNYLTRLPSLMRPQPLAMPFGDDGMASTTVVSVKRKWRRGGGWSMGSRGFDCTKGVDSGQWAAAGERGVEKVWLALYSSLPHASVESLQKESYGGKKKIFPTESGKYPGRGGKKLIFFLDNCTGHCSKTT